jgi:ATP-dependent metalloprotease FtsH
MTNLFLYAKYFAIKQTHGSVTIADLKKAIKNMNLGNTQLATDLVNCINAEPFSLSLYEEPIVAGEENNKIIHTTLLKKILNQPKKDFNIEVKEFIDVMKSKGYRLRGNDIPSTSNTKGDDLMQDARDMKTNLSLKLYGQDLAIETVTDSIKNNILENKNSPKATYIFLGPPATGKTYLAQLMGENLDNYAIKKFDMTQLTHSDNGGTLYGTSRMWGNAAPGSLTSFVRENPKSIIILDEFEKANNKVQTNLLSIFEGGYMQDACGWCKNTGKAYDGSSSGNKENKCSEDEIDDIIDFKQTIFIITSNLGKELYNDHKFLELIEDDYTQAESMILDALKREEKQDTKSGGKIQAIVPELVSRFSQANIVLFNRLNFKSYLSIADKEFKDYKIKFVNTYEIKFNLTSSFNNFLKVQILRFSPQLDARRIKSKIGINFFDRITDHIMSLGKNIDYCKEIKISISKETNEFIKKYINDDIENDKLVKELFRKNLTLSIKDKLTSKNGVIIYKIESIEFKKVKKIIDFSEDGLVFDIPNVKFDDIAGHNKVKQRLNEAIKYLKNPELLEKFDISAPKGVLLYGPPGTGKTLLAKAFAAEADLPFIATTGSDLLDSDTINNIFKKAKEYAPAIIFIDEIDAIGKRGQNNNREIPINKLLSSIDGFSNDPDENIFVIAATNYKENIDSAIIRPGRIELHVEISGLDRDARKYFIDKIIDTKPTKGNIDINKILMYTTGMTGAQLELIGKEASLYCLRHGLDAITQEILIEQINTIKYGEKLTHLSLEDMLAETAIHEAGHAILSRILMPHIKIEQITVTPRGNALGFVSYNYEDAQSNMNIKDFKNRICVSLAGREAQIKKYGNISGMDTGASNDLMQATKDAYIAIAHFGMDEEVGYINIDGIINAQQISTGITDTKHYHDKIDLALARWMDESTQNTKALVDEHWDKIEKLAEKLLEQEVVYENEIDGIVK